MIPDFCNSARAHCSTGIGEKKGSERMEITIKGTPKEIADLVRAIQDRQLMELQKELEKAISVETNH